MKYFNNVNSLEQLKQQYKELAKKYHPDLNKNVSAEIMKQINKEYEELFKIYKTNNNTNKKQELPEDFINLINELIKFQGIIIEVLGSWIWLSGNTYPYKEKIKKLGFKWSRGRKKWYLGEFSTWYKYYKKDKWEDLKAKYNYEKIESKPLQAITA